MLTPKQNYLQMLRGELPEYVPSMYQPYTEILQEELLTPQSAPEGTFVTSFGVEYVGCRELGMGAMPAPGKLILPDITRWRDYIKRPDTSGRDWEGYYKKQTDKLDRENKVVMMSGGDYFLTLVAFMGFENAMLALYEEPEEVKALLEYVSEFYLDVMKRQIKYARPDIFGLMDDDAAYRAPFFSVDMYREFFKPLHKKHCELALENGLMIERHDCGRCEQFIPDWLELGIRGWNPAQTTNDLVGIKKKYAGKLAICGAWDNQGELGKPTCDIKLLKDAIVQYVDTFAPGGGFTYMAMIMGKPEDPEYRERADIIKSFYFDYVKDYYKTHA